jgi:hypothetical protein
VKPAPSHCTPLLFFCSPVRVLLQPTNEKLFEKGSCTWRSVELRAGQGKRENIAEIEPIRQTRASKHWKEQRGCGRGTREEDRTRRKKHSGRHGGTLVCRLLSHNLCSLRCRPRFWW